VAILRLSARALANGPASSTASISDSNVRISFLYHS
jgi:hypothetical protein